LTKKKIYIHQPDFLPWLGYFIKILKCDIFVILDDVQLSRRGYTHRDLIKTNQGIKWITVPIKKKNNFDVKIKDVEIDNSINWKKKHIKTLEQNYIKTPFYHNNFNTIFEAYDKHYDKLIDLNFDLIKIICKILNIPDKKIIFSSEMNIEQKREKKILSILNKLNANTYITGEKSLNYLNLDDFKANNISIDIVKKTIENTQFSVVDFIFNQVSSKNFILRDNIL
jgi:hypothetical protein